MKTITPPKGVKTAKLWKNKAPENKALKICDRDKEDTILDFGGLYSGGDNPEGETVTVGLLKQENIFANVKTCRKISGYIYFERRKLKTLNFMAPISP